MRTEKPLQVHPQLQELETDIYRDQSSLEFGKKLADGEIEIIIVC